MNEYRMKKNESPNEGNIKVGDFEAPIDLGHRKHTVGRRVAPGVGIVAAQPRVSRGHGCPGIKQQPSNLSSSPRSSAILFYSPLGI